ncbi:hypothetical protein BDF19DRAFT_447915 [Syncephalis fuscata]|nr:hypothetical protein BDF19DRAFT_447915 [Syncephalis fuscata]
MVCCETVYRRQPVWSCDRCWAVFHLKCVRKWANNLLQQENATTWRCPGCQQPQETKPSSYRCFCDKRCGEPCGQLKRRATFNTNDANNARNNGNPGCQHPCSLPCHPGPCPPCAAMAPTTYCHCGKESYQVRCTDYRPEGISCGAICGELLGCGQHSCQRECHSGLPSTCYCGRSNPQETRETVEPYELFTGYYACDRICQRWFDCGKHQCEQNCHVQTASSTKCPFSPDLIKSCPCGKQSLALLMDKEQQRTTCTDPIPTCNQACGRMLQCGHLCQQQCHTGTCPPCQKIIPVSCACGGSQISLPCHEQQVASTQPRCDRICNKLKECGKHRCNLRCCTDTDNPDVHLCHLVCSKRLRCGVHKCEQLCHRGHCYPCLEATFDEIACPCGRTRLEPPIACGVTLPKCPYPCTRSSECPHPMIPHECHPDDVACPPCCRCGRDIVRNVPCHRTAANISCGQVCKKMLNCGGHLCQQLCHEGSCDAVCSQQCGKRRSDCGHPCRIRCHAPSVCPISRIACQEPIQLPEMRACMAKGTNPIGITLDCDDECARLIRNQKLADALRIEQFSRIAFNMTHDYESDLIIFAQGNMAFIRKLELDLVDYLDSKKPISSALYLPTMKSNHRRAVHMLCQHYKMETTSIDPEPKRSVVVRRTRLSLTPTPLLSQVAGGYFPSPSINQR